MVVSVNDERSSIRYLRGDVDPSDFDYNLSPSLSDLMTLFKRNGKLQKATLWYASEVIRARWEFNKDQSIEGQKHNRKYLFPSFNDWLEWNKFFQEVLLALTWSLLFGSSILVFYDGNETMADTELVASTKPYVMCKAFYPEINGNGYTVIKTDPFHGNPLKYKISLRSEKMVNTNIYKVSADRVVPFIAPRLDLQYEGVSNVNAIYHDCLIQEQIKRSVMKQANNMQSGILKILVAGEEEKAVIENILGDAFTYLQKVYTTNDSQDIFELVVPDLKIDQMEKIYSILQKDIATVMSMSISNLEGAPQGALSSARYDTINSYAKVKQLQAHYKQAFEECFFKFGKTDTAFTWNDPISSVDQDDIQDVRIRE